MELFRKKKNRITKFFKGRKRFFRRKNYARTKKKKL